MKRLSRLIILVLILIIILIIILLNILNSSKTQTYQSDSNDIVDYGDDDGIEYTPNSVLKKVSEYSIYFNVKNILNNYITQFENINGDVKIDTGRSNITEEEYKADMSKQGLIEIRELFDDQYTKEFTVNEQKIRSYSQKYKNKQGDDNYKISINEMYNANLDDMHDIVLVYSQLNGVEFDCMIKIDWENSRYSIFWDDYLSKNNYTKDKTDEITINPNIIEKNNAFIPVNANKQYIVIQYLDDLKFKMTHMTRKLYDLLDVEYKQKRFLTYEEFTIFLNDIKERIPNINVEKYKYEDNKIQILDNYNNIYTFNISNIMEYTIVLDDYTIPEEEIVTSYLSMEDEKKVYSNIEKFLKMANMKDYSSMYRVLDDTFKENNYKTVDVFKSYIKQNLFDYNVITGVQSLEKNGNYYISTVRYKNGENATSNEKNMTIIMQLKDNTDFVMSFSI